MSSAIDRWKSPAWLFQTKADALYDLLGNNLAAGIDLDVEDAGTDAVVDVLVLKHTSTGTTAAGFGTGLSFQGEDDGGNGAEEWASIDAVAVTVTAASEDADLVFKVKDDGTVKEVLRIVGDTPRLKVSTADAATATVSDMLVLSHSTSGTAAASFGSGISFELEDGSGNAAQEAASIDVQWTTETHGSEEADMIFRVAQTNGTVATLMTLDASADAVVVAGNISATGTLAITGATTLTGLLTAQHKHTNQALTASGAITVTSGLVTLAHATVVIAATKAAPAIGDELYIVNTSASGTEAHTVTLSGGATWDGSATIATLNAAGEALHVIATSATRFFILENIGAVGLS